jgi:Tol biopolymer transport system component
MGLDRVGRIGGAAVIAMALLAPGAGAQTPGQTTVASVSTAGEQGDASSHQPAISADGRFVAFASDAVNLVALDTNANSDVFVYDASTGTTERVSITWQGQEARDDSDCPSISADGRFVAFRSTAWNMYPGGANLGNPIQQVYVHDRAGPSTVRVTVPISGLDPDGEVVDCPDISADGTHVAYASLATNMVAGDTNGAADVFVKNLATGEVERPKFNPAAGEVYRPNTHPSLSGDGRTVAFVSTAPSTAPRVAIVDLETDAVTVVPDEDGNPAAATSPELSQDGRLVAFLGGHASQSGGGPKVVLFDLDATTLTLVSVPSASTDCSHLHPENHAPGLPPCEAGASFSPTISADERFVAFGSKSQLLLPANTNHGSQLYLHDRTTGRVRRLSVDPSSDPGENCSLEPALSADGRVIAYRSTSTNLVATDANGPTADVFRSDWSCGPDGCRTLSLCPPTPSTCEPAARSTLRIRRRPPGGELRDRFHWRWSGAPESSGTPFVDPTTEGEYHLCVYGESPDRVQFDAGIPPGGDWTSRPTGYRFEADDDTLAMLRIRKGSRRSSVEAKGSGPSLDLPYLPIAAPNGVTVQLHESTTGRCWGAHFPAAAIARNLRGSAEAGGEQSGQLRADLR